MYPGGTVMIKNFIKWLSMWKIKILNKLNNVPNDGVGEFISEFITFCGSEGDHQAAEAVQGGHAEPALRGQVWLYEGGGEHVGVMDKSGENDVETMNSISGPL